MAKSIYSNHFFSEPFLLENPPSHFFLPENPEEPEFADWAETNVTAQLGGSVFLHCPVINSGDRAVSYPSVSIFCLLLTHFHSFCQVIIFHNTAIHWLGSFSQIFILLRIMYFDL